MFGFLLLSKTTSIEPIYLFLNAYLRPELTPKDT